MAKKEKIITPKGVFKYTHVNKPDHKGAERFGGEPMFRLTFVCDRDAKGFDAFVERMNKLHKEAYEHAVEAMDEANAKQKNAWKKKGITEPTLNDFMEDEFDEDETPTGRVEFKFKTHSKFKDRKTGKVTNTHVPFIDGKGEVIPWKKRPFVFAGTEGRVAFTTSPVFIPKDADAYLGLYLNQLQITKLAEGGGGSAFGADEESDFTSDELDEYEDNAEDEDDDDLDGGDDDSDEAGDDADLDDEIPF